MLKNKGRIKKLFQWFMTINLANFMKVINKDQAKQ